MGKFRNGERLEVQSIIANLTIKRIPDSLILQHIFNKTGKTLSTRSLRVIRARIKRESYHWYSQLREGEYEYLHEFKERINEITDLQRMHHEIITRNDNDKVYNPSIIQTSLAELHKLNVTLSNYFAVVPQIGDTQRQLANSNPNPNSASTEQQQEQARRMFRIEGCTCPHDGRDIISHNKCRHCLCIWCPTAMKQDWCPNPECSSGIAGCKFEPYDDLRKWIVCKCGKWFKTKEIMDAHKQISFACQDIIV